MSDAMPTSSAMQGTFGEGICVGIATAAAQALREGDDRFASTLIRRSQETGAILGPEWDRTCNWLIDQAIGRGDRTNAERFRAILAISQ